MNRIGIEHLCRGCMSHIEKPQKPCPVCGYDNTNTRPLDSECLIPGHILNKRYLVGVTIQRTLNEFVYIGWDLGLNCRVIIREFYSKDFFKRDNTHSSSIYVNANDTDKVLNRVEHYFRDTNSIMLLGKLEGIISINDVFKSDQTAYCITDYYESISLEQYIESNYEKIPSEQMLVMLKPVIYSLASMHQKGIIHGNISTDTLLVDNQGKFILNVLCSNYQHTYLDDVQNMCKVVYKIICGPNYMTNIFNFSQSHILSFPDNTPKHVIDFITSCLNTSPSRIYNNMFDLYNTLYVETTYSPIKQKKHGNISLPSLRILQPNFIANEDSSSSDISDIKGKAKVSPNPDDSSNASLTTLNSLKKSFPSLTFKDVVGLLGIGLCAFFLFCTCQIILQMKLNEKSPLDYSVSASSTSIVWHDQNFEAAIRNLLNIQRQDIKTEDVSQMTKLDLSNMAIHNLEDIKNFTSLTSLNLRNNRITNITPLIALKKLKYLDIKNNNLKSIGTLKYIKTLESVNIAGNTISDYSPTKHIRSVYKDN